MLGSKTWILVIIVIAQFCCTSVWFAGNSVIADLVSNFNLNSSSLSHLTSSIQFGFIGGTLTFALLNIADRFSPSKIFMISAILAALFNSLLAWDGNNIWTLLSFRFATGFLLAGIYPVGMKIAADYYEKGLGKALSFLVGALVLGTAFPHLLNAQGASGSWKMVILMTSALSVLGGALIGFLVPNGPHRKQSSSIDLLSTFKIFKDRSFRSAAFGYFGHMWELYAFWAFVPIMITTYATQHKLTTLNTSVLSFFIIGIGSLACIVGGYISSTIGVKRTAFISLSTSFLCCLLSPIIFFQPNEYVFILFLLIWGMSVIMDSPLFSTLIAQNAPKEIKGTALTIVNCIGYSITIVSIQLINGLQETIDNQFLYTILALGPIFGLISFYKNKSISIT